MDRFRKPRNGQTLKILDVVSSVLLMAAILLCGASAVQLQTKGYVSVFGYSAFRVITGSMEPTLPVGTLVVSRQTDMNDIAVDDIVCFYSEDSIIFGKINTHRVAALETDENGEKVLVTKGDANIIADASYVTAAMLVGRVVWNSTEGNVIMNVLSLLTSKVGFLACIVVPAMLCMTLIMHGVVSGIKRDIDTMMRDSQRSEPQVSADITQEEYREMYERIKRELMIELGIEGTTHETANKDSSESDGHDN